MMKIERTIEPEYLKVKKRELLSKYLKTGKFDYSYGGESSKLRKDLNAITNNHCVYCDATLLPYSNPEIDHFKPKKKYKYLAYSWINFFPSCGICNNKKRENLLLIRPDAKNYEFKNHFWCKNTGELKPKTKEAKEIIDLFDLNCKDRVEIRLLIYNGEINYKNIDKQPFRYIK